MYTAYVNGEIHRHHFTNGQEEVDVISENLPGGQLEGEWLTPYLIDPTTPATLYAGYDEIYKSTNRGDSWAKISNFGFSQNINYLSVAETNSNYIYAALFNAIFMTDDGGTTWYNITGSLPVNNQNISSIKVDPTNENVVIVTFSGYANNEKVFSSTNGGANWANITLTGLPNLPVNCVEFDKNGGEVYIGTDLGVFLLNYTNNTWEAYGNGLPNVVVTDIDIQYSSSKLRVGTFGRGIWETALNTPTVFNISASVSPANSGTTDGTGTYDYGQTASLTATATTGYDFVNWTENGTEVSANTSYSFTVSEDRTLVANFNIQKFDVSASVSPANSGTIVGTGTFNYGETASIIATATAGYNFVNWTENGTEVSTNASYSFTVSENRTLVANFSIQTFNILASVSPENSGTTTGTGAYDYGQTVNLSSTTNNGYSFENWTENGTEVSTSTTYSFTVSEDRTLVANFKNITGVQEVKNEVNFKVYPNPTTGKFTLEMKDKTISNIQIYNITGRIVFTEDIQSGTTTKNIDLSDLPNGVYILKLSNDKYSEQTKLKIDR